MQLQFLQGDEARLMIISDQKVAVLINRAAFFRYGMARRYKTQEIADTCRNYHHILWFFLVFNRLF